MRVSTSGVGLAAMAALAMVACSPSAVRLGPALAVPSGPPSNACERADFYEAAPARIVAEGATAGVFFNTYYHQDFQGVAVYRAGSKDPETLTDVWPKLNEPRLQQLHEARIEPVDRANRHAVYFALGGIVGLFGGLGTAAAIGDSNRGAATAFGISGLALGIAGAVAALVAQPSGADQLQADARARLFLPPEDDLNAVKRGVDHNNQQVRARCSR